MRARRRVLSDGLVAVAAVGGLALTGCSAPAAASGAGKVATAPGARLWLNRFAGPGHAGDKPSAVAISSGGTTVFVTGTFGFDPPPSPHEDYGTVGYDATTGRPATALRRGREEGAGTASRARTLTLRSFLVILLTMTTMPLGEVKMHLSELVSRVHDHHERVTVTVHGRPSAVLLATEDLERLEETLAILRDTETVSRLAASDTELARGESVSADELADAMRRRPARE